MVVMWYYIGSYTGYVRVVTGTAWVVTELMLQWLCGII